MEQMGIKVLKVLMARKDLKETKAQPELMG